LSTQQEGLNARNYLYVLASDIQELSNLCNSQLITLHHLHDLTNQVISGSPPKADQPRIICITVDKNIMRLATSPDDADRMNPINSFSDLNKTPSFSAVP
jgi:hypothetical protein